MRDEGSRVRDSVLEAIRIAETGGMRLQISHIKLITEDTWGRTFLIRDPVEAAIGRGLRVTTDQHPYTATSTTPEGIRHVLVNGRTAVRDGVVTGVRAGHILRGPGAHGAR
jgi:N-acyl-D-aspartate/D-glutamate deacylase